jgi:hypothetical protein
MGFMEKGIKKGCVLKKKSPIKAVKNGTLANFH